VITKNRRIKVTPLLGTSLIAAVISFTVGVAYGWGMNIVQILNSDFGLITGELVIRLFGVIIFPIGVIMGYV